LKFTEFSIQIFTSLSLIVLITLVFFFTNSVYPQNQNQKCLICHGKPNFKIQHDDGSVHDLFVDNNKLRNSPHKDKMCQDCHYDIIEITAMGHKKDIKKVKCIRCHFENNTVGAPQTDKYSEYQQSIHYKEILKGNPKAPVCQNCHGTHDIVNRSELAKVDFKKEIIKVCGACHIDIYATYATSIHGTSLLEKNNPDVPVCTDCHGEHKIKKTNDSASTVYETNVANTCGKCHSSVNIVEKYGTKADKFDTYEKSFHGISVQFGEITVANCSSCHGIHDIKHKEDPTSTINTANIVKTCGKCHPDANLNYVSAKIHLNSHSQEEGALYYISLIFKWLTLSTIGLLAIHVMLDLRSRFKHRKQKV